jgi:glucose-fructose oxidoreductase
MGGVDMTDRRGVLAGIGLAALGLPKLASAAGGGKPFGYAVVGLGSYATRQIMPNFAGCDHARLTALVSGTPAKLERYGAQYGIPPTHRYSYAQFDRIRDNPDVDAVYVILPNSMHAEYTVRAARAGKHVMCEKPMAVSVAECRAMIAACRQAGRKLMIGYRSRFEPYNRLAIELARGGHAGRTRIVTAEHGFNARPGQWRLDRALSGGGSLMDIGIYSLNAARYLTGEEPVDVDAVETTDRSDPRFRTVEDRIGFLLRFPSGAQATCVSSYGSNHNRYRVVGTDGWIDMEPATSYEGQIMRIHKDGRTEPRMLPAPRRNQFQGQLDHLAECVAQGREPVVAGEEGLADMRVMEAIYRSAAERRRVSLPA